MGLLELRQLMFLQRKRQKRQIRSQIGSVSPSVNKRKGSPCQHNDDDDDTQAAKIMGCSSPDLPEEIWCSIHSLMPMREAARTACLSHAFLCSWRCHPILIFNRDTMGLSEGISGRKFSRRVDRILSKHSGIGIKIFELDYFRFEIFDASRYLKKWLQVAVKPGIEELTLRLCDADRLYNFPCSLLSDGIGDSIRHLKLHLCALRPTAELGPLRNLTSLQLSLVRITDVELECLLYNSLSLEELDIYCCMEILCLKIPSALQQLSSLSVLNCERLKLIESKAPNLSSFSYGGHRVKFLLGETSRIKKLMLQDLFISYARTELPSQMPNLETLVITSSREVVKTPMRPTKFLYLKHLILNFLYGSAPYDYFSLVSFLIGSPSLETLTIDAKVDLEEYGCVPWDPSDLRQMPERRHDRLKTVTISAFSSSKSLVELTCYILKNAVSLECMTLDTVSGPRLCHLKPQRKCFYVPDCDLMEAPRALSVIRTCIEDQVPPSVKLTVLEPCNKCHIIKRKSNP